MQLFTQALTIMCLGMALVFAFLVIVIWGITLTARIIQRYEASLPAPAVPAPDTGPRAAVDPQRLAAVIAVAITENSPAT